MSLAVTILGGGAWGTALAMQMARAGHDTRQWARDAGTVEAIGRGENPRYLPGLKIDVSILATADAARALDGARPGACRHPRAIAARGVFSLADGDPR